MVVGRAGNKRGTAAAEFAMVLPLFVMLILGIVDFGFYFFIQHTLQFATREGTRLALTGQQLTDGKGSFLSREASIVNTIKGYASVAVEPDKLNINIFQVGSDYSDPTDWNKQVNAGSPGAYMRVRTTYTYEFLTPVIGVFFGGNILVQAESTYRNELFDT